MSQGTIYKIWAMECNVCSLNRKLALSDIVISNTLDVISINEMWMKEGIEHISCDLLLGFRINPVLHVVAVYHYSAGMNFP